MVAKVVADATGARTVTRVVFRPPIAARDVSNVEVLHGPGAWEERLGVDTYLVSAPSFFQANSSGAERLREIVTAAVAEVSPTSVADIYAGVGTFTLPLARIAPSTTALEDSGYAVRDLRRNAERAGLDVDIEPGDAARSMSRLAECDVAVVDPPRSGLDPSVIDSLADLGLRRLVYVSCDPATFARDATRLTASGLRLTAVTGIDLFPQTYHVETIAVFDAD
jgi:23S rRNA (uracil1939-C5)-methyltransferase